MQPIQNAIPPPTGEQPSAANLSTKLPLSPVQRTVLERLITQIITLSQQKPAEVWAGLKQDLRLKNDSPLLAQHFPAAEKNLNQRLTHVQTTQAARQVIHQQLAELLPQGNNRQTVSHFIRQQFGQTALSQLTEAQLKTVLTLLKNSPLTPTPASHTASVFQSTSAFQHASALPNVFTSATAPLAERPLQPAEQTLLNQLVSKLATATGESSQKIWHTVLEQVNVKPGEPIPARLVAPLSGWLQAQHTLSQHPAPTLETLQTAIKPPLTEPEREWVMDYSQQRFQVTPHTLLHPLQIQDILSQILLMRSERASGVIEVRDIKPIVSPLVTSTIASIKAVSTRSSAALIALFVVIIVLLIVI